LQLSSDVGYTSVTQYDGFGEATGTVDGLGRLTTNQYDGAGNVTETVVGAGTSAAMVTDTSYDGFGRVASTTDGDGRVTEDFYDADGNVTLSVAGYGTSGAQSTYTSYDADGNATLVVDGLGDATTTAYDADNRVVSVTDASGRSTTTEYDAAGNVTGTLDGLGHLTQSVFDDAGRLVETIDPDGHATGRWYDADGNLTGVVDPDSNLTQYLFDDLGRQTETIDPLGHASHSYYDGDGNVTLSVDALGRSIATQYDADGNVTGVVWRNADGGTADTRGFTYDAADEMLTASNREGTYTFTYTSAGRVSSVSDPFGLTLTMGYDGAGNRTSVSDDQGGLVTSTFDAAGNLSSRSLSAAGTDATVTAGYDGAGRQTSLGRTSGGLSAGETLTSYDAGGLVTGIVTTDGGGGTLLAESYSHDGAGRLSSKTVGGTTTAYGYDAAGQLTSAGSRSYSYDANGVPTSGGLSAGTDNQVSSDGTWDYGYDAAGELTSKSLIAGGTTWTYAYNPGGELTSATEAVGGVVSVEMTYLYDVFGNLVGRGEIDGGSTVVSEVRYAMDGWDTAQPSPLGNENYNAYATLSVDGTVQSRTLFGTGFDQPLATVGAGGAVQWYGADYQGSIEQVFDNSGSTLASASYDPYGNVVSGGLSSVTPYGFQGGMLDSVTGLEHFGARWYDAATQQWLSRDPLGLQPGPNASEFVSDGPTDGTDPSGKLLVAVGDAAKAEAMWQLENTFGTDPANIKTVPLGLGDAGIWENRGGNQQLYALLPGGPAGTKLPAFGLNRDSRQNDRMLTEMYRAFLLPDVRRFVGELPAGAQPPGGGNWPGQFLQRPSEQSSWDRFYIGTQFDWDLLDEGQQQRVVGTYNRLDEIQGIINAARDRTARQMSEAWNSTSILIALDQMGEAGSKIAAAIQLKRVMLTHVDIRRWSVKDDVNGSTEGSGLQQVIRLNVAARLNPVEAAEKIAKYLTTGSNNHNGVVLAWSRLHSELFEQNDENVAASQQARGEGFKTAARSVLSWTGVYKGFLVTVSTGALFGDFAVRLTEGDVHATDALLLLSLRKVRESLARGLGMVVFAGKNVIRFTTQEAKQISALSRELETYQFATKWAANQKQKQLSLRKSNVAPDQPLPTGAAKSEIKGPATGGAAPGKIPNPGARDVPLGIPNTGGYIVEELGQYGKVGVHVDQTGFVLQATDHTCQVGTLDLVLTKLGKKPDQTILSKYYSAKNPIPPTMDTQATVLKAHGVDASTY
jgi:RHS repeat-associated protein